MCSEKVREENIEKVLRQALVSFGECGIETTTLHMLVKQTRLSVRSINRYFDGKLTTKATGLIQASLLMEMQFELFRKNYTKVLLLTEIERYLMLYDPK